MEFQHDNSLLLRFKKVVSYFLDGIPRPFFLIAPDADHGVTFDLHSFGFLPDYTGQTESVYFPDFPESCYFNAVCLWRCGSASPSSRIGSHYSPYIGTFRFDAKRVYLRIQLSNSGRRVVRVPAETCEQVKGTSSKMDRDIRTSFLVDLYATITEGHIMHNEESLRRIVVLGTRGVFANYKETIEHVLVEIKKVYIDACSYSMYRYMSQNSLFRRIISSLCLSTPDDDKSTFFRKEMVLEDRRCERCLLFNESFFALKDSLFWGKKTHQFFIGLQELWMDAFDKLVLFDMTMTSWRTGADVFLAQLGCSMRAAFTRIRVEFYNRLELLLFSSFSGCKGFNSRNVEVMNESELGRIFFVTRIFLVNRIRILILDALKDLVHFFTSAGESVIPPAKARKRPLLEVFLTVGDSGLPCSPSFALLRFGIADLLDELLETSNSLPTPEVVIMRTLSFERRTLDSFGIEELRLKAVLLKFFDAVGSVIEDLTTKYADFSTLLPLNGVYFTRVHASVIHSRVCLLQENIKKIPKVSSDVVFCGCIAINCTGVKKWYGEQWSGYMENYLNAIRNDLLSYVTASVEKCRCHSTNLNEEPKTVEELEECFRFMKNAELTLKEVKEKDCNQVIAWFEYLEVLRIPVDTTLYVAAMDLMRCPNELVVLVLKAEEVCRKSKPFIIDRLVEFCTDTHTKVTTIKDGVDELLGLFNLDLSDIAAQTCMELRVIVDQVLEAIEYISYCEKSLKIEQVDSFEDFFSILRTFEVLEQFWGAIFDSTVVRDCYNKPINSLSTEKLIGDVQRCRRLLHSATRNLRAYPGLVRLGRQQEQVLCNFESLEGVLTCLTAPGLRKSHWKEIARLVKQGPEHNIQIDSNVTLRSLLDFGIHTHLNELRKVVDPAISDFNTEASLERMKSETKRTRFVFKHLEGTKDAFVLSPSCRDSIFSQLELFQCDLQAIDQHAFLSHNVVNSVREWESAVERMRDTLLKWNDVEREWIEILYFGMTLESMKEGEIPAVGLKEWSFLREKVGSVNCIFSVLSITLQKPQYTLFSAMVQEDIQEQLSVAYTILSDIKKVITSLHDARREFFPRFYFLNDEELSSFLSVLNTTSLKRLLSRMYSRVCDVGVEGNMVTTFITADGTILKAKDPIPLSPIPIEHWMGNFERTLRSSFLHELYVSIESHYHVDPMTWLRGSCVQLIDVALRIIYNRDLNDAISIAGSVGIDAYSRRLKDLMEEYVRVVGGTMGEGERRVLFSAITRLIFFRREVELIIQSRVQTKADLDKTAMLQTCMDDEEIFVQTLGLRFPYGMEFLGNYTVPVFTPECVEKGLYSVFLSFAASSFPIFVGEPEKTFSLEHCAQYLGRFWWCLQCYPALTLEGIVQGLRGALSVGAVFCLKDIDLIDVNLIRPFTKLFKDIEASCQSEKEVQGGDVVRIHFEAFDTTISSRRDPCFQVVFTARNHDGIPTNFVLAFRPIYLLPVDLTVLVSGTLQALGVSQFMVVGQRLAVMYEQLIEVSPNVFTIKGILSVIHNAVDDGPESLTERLCTSFLNQFWQAVQTSERVQKLVEWNLIHTLGISKVFLEDALSQMSIGLGFDAVVDRFTSLMSFNTNVVLVGPAYSGRTKLWKLWVGTLPYAVVSFRLMSCAEIYGSASQPGLLSALGKQCDPLVCQTIVMEYVNFSEASTLFDTSTFVRIRPYFGLDFVKGPTVRLVAVVSELSTANPRVMADFAIFVMPQPGHWKAFLKELLYTAPSYHADVAYPVMATLIDYILDTTHTSNCIGITHENFFTAASRCSQFYKRWYVYAQSWPRDAEKWIGEKVFALQCAVFATCWSLGLRLYEKERYVLRTAFEKAKVQLNKVAKDIDFTEDVLPPLEEDVLLYIATCTGWKKLNEETFVGEGLTTAWNRKWTELDVQQRAWLQFFPFPSREPTLITLEHLIRAGQSVLLVGGNGQGKSTILQNMLANDKCLREIVYNNTGCKAVEIQEILLQKLTLRRSKVYGPSVGRSLILCVDDVNISEEGSFSQVMHLFSFINRFSAICPPSIGYIPITDVVCFGVSTPALSYEAEVENAVVRVRLPDLEDSEIVEGVQHLFDAIYKTRQGVEISKGVSALLAEAQAIALHFLSADLSGTQMEKNKNVDLSLDENEGEILQKCGCRSSFGFDVADSVRLSFMHIFLRISDRVLRFLGGFWDDREALKNILSSVYAFYASMLRNEEQQVQFKTLLQQSARKNLKSFFEPEFFLPDTFNSAIAEEKNDGIDFPPCTPMQVEVWVRAYEAASAFTDILDEPNIDFRSSIIFPPPPLKNRELRASNSGMMASCLVRAKYPSQWMSSRILALYQYLRQEQTHVALIGFYGDGIRRALRILGAVMRVHVAFFRDSYSSVDGNVQFKSDIISVVQRVCRNDGRLVVFVPNSMLELAWPMGCLDAIVRSGDVTRLFSNEEMLFLLYGRRGVLRASGCLTPGELLELRQRIRKRLSIVTHIFSYRDMKRLGDKIPLISFTLPVSLHISDMLSELMSMLLRTEEEKSQSMYKLLFQDSDVNNTADSLISVPEGLPERSIVYFLCKVCDVMKMDINIQLDHLLEFGFQTQRLLCFLERLRSHCAQSRHITNLPSIISEKTKEYNESYNKAASLKLETEKQIQFLFARSQELEKLMLNYQHDIDYLCKEAESTEAFIAQEEETIQSQSGNVATTLATAAARLSSIKPSQIKHFGTLLPFAKGVLLVKAVCRLIGVEIPAGKAKDVWESGKAIMMRPKFVSRLMGVTPSTLNYGNLSQLHASLREVRYNDISVFAGAVAEYVVTVMEATRVGEFVRETHVQLNEKRLYYTYFRGKLEKFQLLLDETLKKTNEVLLEIERLKKECEDLDAEMADLDGRQCALTLLLDIVDRFGPFHSPEEAAKREVLAKKGEGAVIMFAAHRAFFAMYPLEKQDVCFRQLQLMLNAWGIAAPTDLHDPVVSLLFPSLDDIADKTFLSACSTHERLCAGALLQRVFLYWPFFGGASPAFVRVVKQILKVMCGSCIVTSAFDTNFTKSCFEAFYGGLALLICDASVSLVMKKLRPLLLLQSSFQEAQVQQGLVKVSIFGKDVEIKSSFYLVCVSSAPVPSDTMGSALSRFMNVTNFYLSVDVDSHVCTTLMLCPKMSQNGTEYSSANASGDDEQVISIFGDATRKVSTLLCEDIDVLTGDREGKLSELDVLIGDLNAYHVRVLRLESQQKNFQKRLDDSWKYLKEGMRSVERALRVIEVNILGRYWHSRKLEAFITSASELLQPYQLRISPNKFESLSELHKEFYATVSFIDRVVQVFACGWPCELRGLFAWYILSSVVANSELIFRLKGELYSSSTFLLSGEQYRVLDSLLNRGDNVINEEFVRNLYATSTDNLFVQIASNSVVFFEDNTEMCGLAEGDLNSGCQSLVRTFFKEYMEQNYTFCDLIASHFYNVFLLAVKEQRSDVESEIPMLYDFLGSCSTPVHSFEEWLQFSLGACAPLSLISTNLYDTLKHYERLFRAENVAYQFYSVSTAAEVEQLMETVSQCFHRRPENQGRGHCITAMLVPPAGASEKIVFIQTLAAQFSRYCQYGVWGPLRDGEISRFPVLLCCALWDVSGRGKNFDSTMTSNSDCIRVLEEWCLFLKPETSFSRFYLLSLLKDRTVFPQWRLEGTTLLLEPDVSKTQGTKVPKGFPSRHGFSTAPVVKMENVIEFQVGICSRQIMLRALWENEGLCGNIPMSWETTIDRDDLTLILRLMRICLQGSQGEEIGARSGRSARFLTRQSYRGSMFNALAHVSYRQEPEQLKRTFNKLAYGIYAARMTSSRCRLAVGEMLRQRIFLHVPEGRRRQGASVVIEEAPRTKTLESTFLTDLLQSDDDFLSLSGDGVSAAAYRKVLDDTFRRLLYGIYTPSRTVVFINTVDTTQCTIDTVAAANTNLLPSCYTIQLLFLWEKSHMETLIEELTRDGHIALASRVRLAMVQLISWVPGEILTTWLPALQYPRLLLHVLAAQAVCRKADDIHRVEMVLVLLRRYNLLHDDIVLSGAALSKQLEEEVLVRTSWNVSNLVWLKENYTKEHEEDVVIAARFQRNSKEDVAGTLSDLLWEVGPNEKKIGNPLTENINRENFAFLTETGVEVVSGKTEIRSTFALPVLCASAASSVGEEVRDWHIIFHLPLCIIMTDRDIAENQRGLGFNGSHTTLEKIVPVELLSNPTEGTSTSTFHNSLTFFVTIS